MRKWSAAWSPFDVHSFSLLSKQFLLDSLHERAQMKIPEEIVAAFKGNGGRCYDAERTVCDVFRARNRMDSETVVATFRNYAVSPDRDLPKLARYARRFGICDRLHRQLEVAL